MNDTETDAELVTRLREGNREAADRLVGRYLRPARAVALAVLRDVELAEDACQDAFVYAIGRIDECREPARFGGWLLTIVRNRSRNILRDRAARRTVPMEDTFVDDRCAPPDLSSARSEARRRLLDAMRTLSEERRTVLLLHDLEGWTHVEIADRLGMPPGTVRSHLHHARKAVRARLGGGLGRTGRVNRHE